MHFHMPIEFDAMEPALRAAIRKRVVRGHVQVQVFWKRSADGAGGAVINETLLRAWIDSFRDAARQYGLDYKPDLNQALRIPGMIESRTGQASIDAELETELLAAASEALEDLEEFRLREGASIDTEIRMRTGSIQDLVRRMEDIRATALPHFHDRLRERLGELLGDIQLDASRIAQEAATLADRSDITEELVRLRTHAAQADELLTAPGETGKKLDFLLQEMNREANTILSKTSGLGEPGLILTDLALGAKAEIDRIREQALNIE